MQTTTMETTKGKVGSHSVCKSFHLRRYRSLRPNFHPVDFPSFVGVTRKSTVTPPAT